MTRVQLPPRPIRTITGGALLVFTGHKEVRDGWMEGGGKRRKQVNAATRGRGNEDQRGLGSLGLKYNPNGFL